MAKKKSAAAACKPLCVKVEVRRNDVTFTAEVKTVEEAAAFDRTLDEALGAEQARRQAETQPAGSDR